MSHLYHLCWLLLIRQNVIVMKYYNYRFRFTKIFTFTVFLSVLSLFKVQEIMIHTKWNCPTVFGMNKKLEAKKQPHLTSLVTFVNLTSRLLLKGVTGQGDVVTLVFQEWHKRDNRKKLAPFLLYFLKEICNILLYFPAFLSNEKILINSVWRISREK